MPYLVTYPQINGHRFSPQSVEAIFNGIPILGLSELNYNDSLEPGDVYGSTPQVIGRTRGKQKAGADFGMYQQEYENLKLTLGVAGVGYMETPFVITVTYFEVGTLPIIDTIIGARITKDEISNSMSSTDAVVVKATCNILRVLRNGVPVATPINVGI